MRSKFFAGLGVAATLTLAACSSNDVKPSASGNTAAAVNAPVAVTASNSGNSNTNVVALGNAVIPPPTDANSMSGETADANPQLPQMQNRLDKLGKKGTGPTGPPVDVAALAMKLARPAPDNSTFTSYLSDAGYEIRTFLNHPQLKKVEKRTTDDGKVTIKVFLRSGKVVELPGTAIPVLSTAPASQIMNAAGISAPAVAVKPDPKKANQ